MALATQGFALSSLPRSPQIPANAGAVDVKEIYDGVRQGLAAFENVRRAPASMLLADAEAKEGTAQAPIKTRQLLATTEGIELRNALLGMDATPEMQAAKLKALLAKGTRSSSETGAVQTARALANAQMRLAEDPNDTEAEALVAALGPMAVKYGAKTLVDPQGKTAADVAKSAANNATTLAAGAARNATSESNTTANNATRQSIAANKPGTDLQETLNRLAKTRRALIDNPADEEAKLAYLDADLAFNKLSANSRADPTADRNTRAEGVSDNYERAMAKHTMLAQLADAEDDPILKDALEGQASAFWQRAEALNEQAGRANKLKSDQETAKARITAQAETSRANREQKLSLVDAQHQLKLSHALGALETMESNTKHVDDLINDAIALTDNFSAGIGKNLAFLPVKARTLKGKLDSIRSNIGFDALSTMRQNSPTGGALGAVSDTENKLLQSTIEALDQGLSPDQLKKNLESVRQQRKLSLNKLSDTYYRDLDILSKRPITAADATNAQTPAANQAPPSGPEVGKIYPDANGNKARFLGEGKWEEVP